MPISFNSSLLVFPPKGEEDGDEIAIERDSKDTRPISLKNSDNKIVSSVGNFSLSAPIALGSCRLQRGFIRGRQLIHNVLDLDTDGRCLAMQEDRHAKSVFVFWDFAAAFPSLAHGWIHLILSASESPDGLLEAIKGIYFFNFAKISLSSSFIFAFAILSGVLQGCPLSGSIFAVSLDPFLRWMEKDIEATGRGTVRACADDIGAALGALQHLVIIEPIFRAARLAAGLTLKPSKCVIVPLFARCNLHIISVGSVLT